MTEATQICPAVIHLADAIEFLNSLSPESLDLIVTDPAYSSMNQHLQLGRGRIVGLYKDRGEGGKWFTEFADTPENYRAFLAACHRVLRPDGHLFIMFDAFSLLALGPLVKECFPVKNVLVWDKVLMGMGHNFRRQTEFILFAMKGKRALSSRALRDIIRTSRVPPAKSIYPTQKPIELFEYLIAASHHPGESQFVVCDPFVGSGSSAIAALRQGVTFVGCDISERAVELARERVRAFIEDGAEAKPTCDEDQSTSTSTPPEALPEPIAIHVQDPAPLPKDAGPRKRVSLWKAIQFHHAPLDTDGNPAPVVAEP